jgi:Protein of unknown function (DUF4238)
MPLYRRRLQSSRYDVAHMLDLRAVLEPVASEKGGINNSMRHHYVPQFLLRAWAETTLDKKVEIFRLDRPQLPSSRRSPKHTAYEKNLYALTLPMVAGMEQQAVERHLLQHIDQSAADVLRKLSATGLVGLTPEQRSDWARFLMSLRLRQPTMIQQLCIQSSQHLEVSLTDQPEEYESLAEVGDPPTLLDWTRKNYPGLIENAGMSFFHEIIDNRTVAEKILRMRWWLWDFAREENDLLLADHPCIFTKGIDEPDLVIALPIGPRKVFMATRTDHVATIMRRQRPKDLLMRMNESSLSQARIRLYARDRSPWRFISNRLVKLRSDPHRLPLRRRRGRGLHPDSVRMLKR